MFFHLSIHNFWNTVCRSSRNFFFINFHISNYTFFKYPDRLYLWPIIIFVIFLSFLSKQVPFAYVCLLQGLVIFFFLIKEKSFKVLLTIFFSILITFLIFYIFLIFLKIDIKLFLLNILSTLFQLELTDLAILIFLLKAF